MDYLDNQSRDYLVGRLKAAGFSLGEAETRAEALETENEVKCVLEYLDQHACARNVYDIYVTNEKQKSTQLIFCDTSTPKKDFNVYDELRTLLENMGVKSSDIAYIHDYENEIKRQELFDQFQNGDIRILIGSTFKLGIGVNVQNKLLAVHHLDVPWRPAEEGHTLRYN